MVRKERATQCEYGSPPFDGPWLGVLAGLSSLLGIGVTEVGGALLGALGRAYRLRIPSASAAVPYPLSPSMMAATMSLAAAELAFW